MEAIIKYINIYNDGLIEMVVICNICKSKNIHNITHTVKNNDDKLIIDFSQLGKRCCGNFKNVKQEILCEANYNLYACI